MLGSIVVLAVAGYSTSASSVVLNALADGFAGSLSTISTFVKELDQGIKDQKGARVPLSVVRRKSFE
jgi:fluoride ion exporter CrcB/FEX